MQSQTNSTELELIIQDEFHSKIESNINNSIKNYNTIIACDNTGSMGQSVMAMAESMSQVDAIFELTTGRRVIKAVVGDQDNGTEDNHQGGVAILPETANSEQIKIFTEKQLKTGGGGGMPEAYKTLLNILLKETREQTETIMCLFLDAIPHGVGSDTSLDSEGIKEKDQIDTNNMIWDWDALCLAFKNAGQHVIILITSPSVDKTEIWSKLGHVVSVNNNDSSILTKTLLSVLYAMIGQQQDDSLTYSFRNKDNGKLEVTNKLIPVYKSDLTQTFKNVDPLKVINVFDNLLDKGKPKNALALTTSPILGKAWRLICGSYKYILDRKQENECQHVMDKLSACNVLLDNSDKTILKDWIDLSHDETPQIRIDISKAMNASKTFLILPEELRGTVSLDDVLDLGRGGGNFKELGQLIVSMQIDNNNLRIQQMPIEEDVSPDFLPIEGLKPQAVFSLIGNLLSPGLRFSKTVSFMAAILALPNKQLGEIASNFLQDNKGKWINWELKEEDESQKFPVFWSINFIRLLKLCPNVQLTDEEIKFRDNYQQIDKVITNHNAEIEVKIPIIISGNRSDVTWKRYCDLEKNGCGHNRCFTIFPGNSDICGICIGIKDPEKIKDLIIRELETNPENIEEIDHNSNWVQCYTCSSNQGVTRITQLKVRAKCHACRFKDSTREEIMCNLCLHKYCSPSGSAMRAMRDAQDQQDKSKNDYDKLKVLNQQWESGEFICPRCLKHQKEMTVLKPIKISELIAQNTDIIKYIPVSDQELMMKKNMKLWKKVKEVTVNLYESSNILNQNDPINIYFNNFKIHNSNEVIHNILNKLMNSSGMGMCLLCANNVSVKNLVASCGSCDNRICTRCFNQWYSQVEIGKIVAQGHTLCPFCKSTPKHALITNLTLAYLRNIRTTKRNKNDLCQWIYTSVYASCRLCLKVLPAFDRECADVVPIIINNFACETCTDIEKSKLNGNVDISKDFKKCPKCNAPTQKSSGCNHITCTNSIKNEIDEIIGTCLAHWCWTCGKDSDINGEFNSHTIQDHMAKCGGIFPDDINQEQDAEDQDVEDEQ